MRMTFTGLEQDSVYYLQLRTKSETNVSDWSRRFELLTLKDMVRPAPVTNLSGVMNEGNLIISWSTPRLNEDGSNLEDLKDYVITVTPSPEDVDWPPYVFYAEGNKAIFSKEDNSAAFGYYRSGLKVVVQARDIVDNLSDPTEIIRAKPKAGKVRNLSWTIEGTSFVARWDKPLENVDRTPFTDLDGYQIKVIYTNPDGVETILIKDPHHSNTYTLSVEENRAAFGGANIAGSDGVVPLRSRGVLTLEVRVRDSVGQLSDADPVVAKDVPPAKVKNVVATGGINLINIGWDLNPPEDGVLYYEVWIADNSTSVGNFIGRTTTSSYIYDTASYFPHYIYVYAVDVFGSTSNRSDSISATPKNPFGVDNNPPGLISELTVQQRNGGELPAALFVDWIGSTGAAGYHVSYSINQNPPVWEYVDIPSNTEPTEALLSPLVANTSYIIRVRSYDSFLNASDWVSTTANSPDSQIKVTLNDISSDIQIISGGTLRSGNYDELAKTGWRLMPSGLDIQSGSINAFVLKTGEIRSNILVDQGLPDAGQPLWNINLDGNLTVRNALVKGQVFVGDPSLVDNDRVQIGSYTFGSLASNQWALKGDGSFVTRGYGLTGGRLEVSSDGVHGFDIDNVQRIAIRNNGQFAFQTTNGGLVFDDNGLRLFSGSTETVTLDRSGSARFIGELRSATGLIGGWVLSEVGFSSGLVSLRSDLGEIRAGSSTQTVGMRANYGFWAGSHDPLLSPPFSVSLSGSLIAKSGEIGGFKITGGDGLVGGISSATVGMRPSQGFWAGASSYGSAPTTLSTDGTLFSRKAKIQGEIQATRFVSSGSVAGTGNWIEIGNVGIVDPVDEIRFYLNGTVSSLRNPSIAPGGLIVSVNSGRQDYTFMPERFQGFRTNGAIIDTNSGDILFQNGTARGNRIEVNTAYSSNYWNKDGTAYVRSSGSTNVEVGGGGQARILSMGHLDPGGSKTFVIDHPKKKDSYLVHATLEGPTPDVFYRGTGRLSPAEPGETTGGMRIDRAEVTLPDYFEELTKLEGRSVEITPIVGPCDSCGQFLAPAMGASDVVDGKFKVYALAGYVHPCARFYWEVKGIRKDVEQFEVEPNRAEYVRRGEGPYTYLTKRVPGDIVVEETRRGDL